MRDGALWAAILGFFFLFVFQCGGCQHSLFCDLQILKEFLCKSLHVPIKITTPFLQHAAKTASIRDEGGIKRRILNPFSHTFSISLPAVSHNTESDVSSKH